MNYTEALNYIHSLGNFKLPAGLQRITAALSALSCPQNKFDAIHIAGTNGKGSVSAMLAKIFETAGFKTGLYISPYIIDFRERIQINGNFISEDDLIKYSQRVKNTKIVLSEFEFITAAAFSYFADEKCDIVIAETGLGGRLDATNTLERVRAALGAQKNDVQLVRPHVAPVYGALVKAARNAGVPITETFRESFKATPRK